jgi:riboflavin synthase
MFTGLIEGTGTLVRIDSHGPDAKMIIRADFALEKVVLGESIAVDGVCLTVVAFQKALFTVDVSAETLNRTTLGRKTAGSRLNLERAMRLGDRLGGHLVAGHVDGIGLVRNRYAEGRSWRLVFAMPEDLDRYVIAKGSIAINGISLTVNGCETQQFDVNIVPHTGRMTTIGDWQIGTEVNLETDLIGKYVEKMVRAWTASPSADQSGSPPSAISADFLRKHGFMD